MAVAENGDTGLINVSSYRRDLYQLSSLLHADEKVAGVAEFKELSEVNHETDVNRLFIIHAVEITSYDPDYEYHRGFITVRGKRRRRSGLWQANRAMLDFDLFAKHCIGLS